MDIDIRKIQNNDVSGFYDALCDVANEKIYLLTTTPPPYDKIEKFVKNNIANNNAQYIALLNNNIIGWADIIPLERNTMSHVGHLGMGVLSDFRSQGIGLKLLQKTMTHAFSQGLTRLELEVFSDNQSAIALYKKCGFNIEGVKRYARLFSGNYQDIVIMAQYKI